MDKVATIINPDKLLSLPNIANKTLKNDSTNLINNFRNETLSNYEHVGDVGAKQLMEILQREEYE